MVSGLMVNIRLNTLILILSHGVVHLSMLYALLMCSDTVPLRQETESFVAAKQEQSYPVLARSQPEYQKLHHP